MKELIFTGLGALLTGIIGMVWLIPQKFISKEDCKECPTTVIVGELKEAFETARKEIGADIRELFREYRDHLKGGKEPDGPGRMGQN